MRQAALPQRAGWRRHLRSRPELSGTIADLAIRAERPEDAAEIHEVLADAFPSDAEARLVERLRGVALPLISLVAVCEARIVGHVLFSPVEVGGERGAWKAMALGPVGVIPSLQRRGAGSALIEAGLGACCSAGESVVFVLGHASYYPRFGFHSAWDAGCYYQSPGPNPSFMVVELEPGALAGRSGPVRYHPAFDGL